MKFKIKYLEEFVNSGKIRGKEIWVKKTPDRALFWIIDDSNQDMVTITDGYFIDKNNFQYSETEYIFYKVDELYSKIAKEGFSCMSILL